MIVHHRWTRRWTTVCSSLRSSMLSMQTTSLSSKSCRASWMSWLDRWSRFLSGTTTSFPWTICPSPLSFMTGTGKTDMVHFNYQQKEEKYLFIIVLHVQTQWNSKAQPCRDFILISLFHCCWELWWYGAEWLYSNKDIMRSADHKKWLQHIIRQH